jgi:putative ABC transport system substrate-binding protein
MRRRQFITLLGGAAMLWPLAARAQQPERMRRIGVLAQAAANDPETAARLTAFVQGLQELGWSVGRNARIEYRWAAANYDLIRKYAAELVASRSAPVSSQAWHGREATRPVLARSNSA